MAHWMTLAAMGLVASGLTARQRADPGSGGSRPQRFDRGYAFVRDREIFAVDRADCQAAQRLTRSGSNSDPSISTDSRLVAYVHLDGAGRSSIRVVPSGGGSESELVAGAPGELVSQPAVSADARRVLYIASRGTTARLRVIDADGSSDRAVPESTYDASPAFFPDGERALVLTGPDTLTHTELAQVDLGSGARTPWSLPSLAGNLGSRAVVSPDGASVAFEAPVGGHPRIFVASASGDPATLRQVSGGNTGQGDDRSPTWVSPTRLGFSSDVGGLANRYEVDLANAGDAHVVVPDAEQASYAPGVGDY